MNGKPAPPVAHPATRIGYLAHMLALAVRARVERALTPVHLTHPQLDLLLALATGPSAGLPAADLARLAGAAAPQEHLPDLADRGLISCGGDGDAVTWVRLTRSGHELVARADELTNPVEENALARLSSGERETLRALLLRTMTTLDQESWHAWSDRE